EDERADFAEPAMLTRLRNAVDTMRTVGRTPDRDLSINYTLTGGAAMPLAIAGSAPNKSSRFYPCVRLQFGLFRKSADGLVRAEAASIILRRIRGEKKVTFQQQIRF